MAYLTPQDTGVVVNGTACNVTSFRTNAQARIAEVTVTGAFPGTLGAGVRYEPQWEISVPYNSVLFAAVLGLAAGNDLASLTFVNVATLQNTVIESTEYTCDAAGDVVRVRVSGRHGRYS